MESSIGNIVHAIQLAVAPVFLLTAVATLISVMNVRLARVVDRRRVLNARKAGLDERSASADVAELAMLHKRGRLIYFSMFSAVLSAWLVCVIVAAAFLGAMFSVDVAKLIAIFFVLAMLAMIAALTMFLREVYIGVAQAWIDSAR